MIKLNSERVKNATQRNIMKRKRNEMSYFIQKFPLKFDFMPLKRVSNHVFVGKILQVF